MLLGPAVLGLAWPKAQSAERLCARWPWLVAVVLGVCVLQAADVTESRGLTAIFGAFVVGLMIPPDSPHWDAPVRWVSTLGLWLVPVFFIATGLTIWTASGGIPWLVAILATVLAVLSKIGGGYAVSRLGGEGRAEALRVGVMLNTRGLTEIVLLQAGYSAGVLTSGAVSGAAGDGGGHHLDDRPAPVADRPPPRGGRAAGAPEGRAGSERGRHGHREVGRPSGEVVDDLCHEASPGQVLRRLLVVRGRRTRLRKQSAFGTSRATSSDMVMPLPSPSRRDRGAGPVLGPVRPRRSPNKAPGHAPSRSGAPQDNPPAVGRCGCRAAVAGRRTGPRSVRRCAPPGRPRTAPGPPRGPR
ncbi:cation:proton antiporter domain-containing protein [Streptomyces sp. NPDC005151]